MSESIAGNFVEDKVILIDKPYGWTSFDVVKKIRNTLKIKKVGHAGTLDPLATGLLIVCTGKKTKEINFYQGLEKEYEGEMILGKTTPSVDLETDFESEKDVSHLSHDTIVKPVDKFIGHIKQVPPLYSAIKIKGKRGYNLARKGKTAKIEPKDVIINNFAIENISLPNVSFNVTCSKGTYIRSLVRDYGQELGVGACLSQLRRTRIGEYKVSDAETIESFVNREKSSF